MSRRKRSIKDILTVMVRQAVCPRCGLKLGRMDDVELDHIVPLALGGEDTLDNLQAMHRDCHKVKTHGHCGYRKGSDRARIAKARREARGEEEQPRRVRRKIPSRPLRSRNTLRKNQFNETVERS